MHICVSWWLSKWQKDNTLNLKPLILIIRMFNLKFKTNNESQFQQRKPVSPGQPKIKQKKGKQIQTKSTKSLIKDTTIIPIKRKNHLPSKSSIETLENKLYNSPNFELHRPNDPRKLNQCTFTHLLQQHPKPQTISSNSVRAGLTENTDFRYSYNQEVVHDNQFRKTPIANLTLTLTPAATSFTLEDRTLKEVDFSSMLHYKLSAIQDQAPKSVEKSLGKEGKKSPYRVVNTNRLNNTPKIKENGTKQHKEDKIENKTFAAVLNSSGVQVERFSVPKQQTINLECSQKIYKFLSENTNQKQQRRIKSPRNKSNLLSTGILNLSQPVEPITSNRPQLSKETIQSRLHIDEAISEENIKAFSSQGSIYTNDRLTYSKEHFPSRIFGIKNKIKEINDKLAARNYNQNQFSHSIQSKYNPQLGRKGSITMGITQLVNIKEQFQEKVAELMHKLRQIRQNTMQQIDDQIQNMKISQKTLIDWCQLQKQLTIKDRMDSVLFKNQLLNYRLDNISATFNLHFNKNQITLPINQQKYTNLEMELNLIEHQIAQSVNIIEHPSPNLLHGEFKTVKQKINGFHQKVKELHNILQSMV